MQGHKVDENDVSEYLSGLSYHISKYDKFLFINVYKNKNKM